MSALAVSPLPEYWSRLKPGAVFSTVHEDYVRGVLTERGYVHWSDGETSLPEELEYGVIDGKVELVLP